MRALPLLALLLSGAASAQGTFRRGRPEDSGPRPLYSFSVGDGATSIPGATYTRAGTRTCAYSNGTVATLSANVPCITAKGVLMERGRTNIALRSEELDNAYWLPQADLLPRLPVVTQDAGVAPDGTTTAERVDLAAVTGSQYSLIHHTAGGITVSSGVAYTLSFWAKGVSGSGTFYAGAYSGAWFSSPCAYTNTAWVRCAVTLTTGTTSLDPLIGVDLRDAAQSTQPAQSVYVWGVQLEASGYARSYVATTSAAASADPDVLRRTANTGVLATGSVAVSFTPLYSTPSNTGYFWYLDQVTFATGPTSRRVSHYVANVGRTTDVAGYTWTPGTTYRLRQTWGAGNTDFRRDGVVDTFSNVTDGSATMPSTVVEPLYIGTAGGDPFTVDGYVNAFCISNKTSVCR